jgi:hypothetical protein
MAIHNRTLEERYVDVASSVLDPAIRGAREGIRCRALWDVPPLAYVPDSLCALCDLGLGH